MHEETTTAVDKPVDEVWVDEIGSSIMPVIVLVLEPDV
jgi:hypothetical protein